MSAHYDVVIRNGLVVDGTGAEPRRADVAVKDGLIAVVGEVKGAGAQEIDAKGLRRIQDGFAGEAIMIERLRMVDGRRLNPATIMPAYYSLDGLVRVGRAWQGRTILTAEEIEDVVAFLVTLRD